MTVSRIVANDFTQKSKNLNTFTDNSEKFQEISEEFPCLIDFS